MKCDAVFEGGGVKGISLVGAVAELERAGYEFVNVAGTSAGAIVASLLAAGFTAEEMKKEIIELDFHKIKQEKGISKFGIAGKIVSLLHKFGIYSSDYFEDWMEERLNRKGVRVFSDLLLEDSKTTKYRYKLQVIASNLSERELMILPWDIKRFGLEPDSFPVARAVAMSMSIPFYFRPEKLVDVSNKTHYIVDGGLLSNYPVWLLDDNEPNPPWPTFGIKLSEPPGSGETKGTENIDDISGYSKSVVSTALDAHDNYHVSVLKGDKDRTIFISNKITINGISKTIGTTDFDLTTEEALALYDNGVRAAAEFMKTWSFEAWKKKYRG